jgi:hypothetical protein
MTAENGESLGHYTAPKLFRTVLDGVAPSPELLERMEEINLPKGGKIIEKVLRLIPRGLNKGPRFP